MHLLTMTRTLSGVKEHKTLAIKKNSAEILSN